MGTRFEHAGPETLRLGLVVADGVEPEAPVEALEKRLEARLAELAAGLDDVRDAYRSRVRDVFRNGRYKPTGRGKPASEYLLKVAAEAAFPRINTLVDICNALSIGSLLPISIWDLDRAGTDRFEFRLGAVDESYVFNSSGQEISLEDLIVGCRILPGPSSEPIVNAVKDSQATKTNASTRRVAAAIYAPMEDGPDLSLEQTCLLFEELLTATSPSCTAGHAILAPGETVELS